MAAITRISTTIFLKGLFHPTFRSLQSNHNPQSLFRNFIFIGNRRISSSGSIQCAAASEYGDAGKKASARLSQVQQLLLEAEERANSAVNEPPPPKISLVNTKVDMRFNVKNATWLSERVRDKIMQMEKNRINKDGEIVISSTKTRTQQGNIEDALAKLQAIIDAAAYVPPPPSEDQKKKIAKLAAKSEQKRLQNKKALSQKKSFRRSKDGWD